MGRVERVRNLDGQRQHQLGFHGTAADTIFQRDTLQKLHRDEGFAVLIVNFVDGADILVIQGGGSLSFALEAAEGQWIFGNVVGQKLESYKTTEVQVLGFIDHAHSAATKFLEDAVVRDGLADHWSRI